MTNKIQNYFTILKEFISKISGKVNSDSLRIDNISKHIINDIDPDIDDLKTNILKKDDIYTEPNDETETYTLYINKQ